jgi:hypothetical protein
MKVVKDLYSHYRIPPHLQMHQLRVAAIGKVIAEAQGSACDVTLVVQTGLLHDMGNIMKVQFHVFPEFWKQEGVAYWEKVQQDFFETYGNDEHKATIAIAREIGVSEAVITCFDMISFSQIESLMSTGTLEQKIANYADMRVGPFGVLSLSERLDEIKHRYSARTDRPFNLERHNAFAKYELQLEQELFQNISLRPEDITDTHIAPIIQQLSCYTFPA